MSGIGPRSLGGSHQKGRISPAISGGFGHYNRKEDLARAFVTYKLFETTLGKAMGALEIFKESSLDKINDGRGDADFDVSAQLIELSVERLREKIERIHE